jgi:hypothetical protein
MRREAPVRFLGGGGTEMCRCYPTSRYHHPNHTSGQSRLAKSTANLCISGFINRALAVPSKRKVDS